MKSKRESFGPLYWKETAADVATVTAVLMKTCHDVDFAFMAESFHRCMDEEPPRPEDEVTFNLVMGFVGSMLTKRMHQLGLARDEQLLYALRVGVLVIDGVAEAAEADDVDPTPFDKLQSN